MLTSIVERHPDWQPSNEQWDRGTSSILTDLRHNRIPVDGLSQFPALVAKSLASALAFDDKDPLRWQEILNLHKEFVLWKDLFSERQAWAGMLGLAWIEDGARRIAEVRYLPSGDWQTVRLRIDAPRKTQLSGLLFGRPCRAWIRRCFWTMDEKQTAASIRPGLGSSLSYAGGLHRLDGVFEPNQITVTTPSSAGPYELVLEFLLEFGPRVSEDAASALSKKLDQCVNSIA